MILIPIGITVYLTILLASVSSNILPKEINPNYYLPYNIPGLEIIIAVILITIIGWISLSFIGKKLIDLFENILKKIPILRTIYSAIGQMTESLTKKMIILRMWFWLNIQEKVVGRLALQLKKILEK